MDILWFACLATIPPFSVNRPQLSLGNDLFRHFWLMYLAHPLTLGYSWQEMASEIVFCSNYWKQTLLLQLGDTKPRGCDLGASDGIFASSLRKLNNNKANTKKDKTRKWRKTTPWWRYLITWLELCLNLDYPWTSQLHDLKKSFTLNNFILFLLSQFELGVCAE